MSNVLIALGGNALGESSVKQLELVREASRSIIDLIEEGHGGVVAHWNGPQVWLIHQAFDEVEQMPDVPMAEAVAMSQRYIGYHLQQALREELQKRVIPSPEPIEIVEVEVIRSFVTAGHVVIAGSGCGIPLIRENHHLVGVDAVIDKDWASELLARELNIDVLFILTAVD